MSAEHVLLYLIVVAGFTALLMFYLVIRKCRTQGLFIAQKSHAQLRFKKCKTCDGCGVTWMGGIIPLKYRSYLSNMEGGQVNNPIANTEKCSGCHGLGGYWVDTITGVIRPPVQDRRIGETWGPM